jgi:hypothetical protein
MKTPAEAEDFIHTTTSGCYGRLGIPVMGAVAGADCWTDGVFIAVWVSSPV